MKRAAILLAIGAIVIFAIAALRLPPRRLALAPTSDGTVPGILHVHTNRSDGRGSPDEIAAAAARAGLRFVVFADHGDGSRPLEPPVYRSGVLCLDGVEISTGGGHYIALDIPASPYPLAGEARDVVDDVRRLGGFGIVAHPDSPKPELRWSAWDAPFDAVEWINPDTSWRVHAAAGWGARFRLLEALLQYPFRSGETMAELLTSLDDTLSRWTSVAMERPLVGLAGVDAHAKLALHDADPGDNRFTLPLPSYEATFGLLSVHATLERPFSGDAAIDAASLLGALRAGRLYIAIDALASPSAFEFSAANALGTAGPGESLGTGGPVSLRVRSNAAPGFTTLIWQGGRVLTSREGGEIAIEASGEPAVYRAEVRAPGDPERPRPWLLSNPIYVRAPGPAAPLAAPSAPPSATLALFDGQTDAGWHIETDPSSLAAVDVSKTVDGSELRVRFGLSGAQDQSLWAALAWGTPIGHPPTNVARYDRLTFTARAGRPMRISVQLRALDANRTLRRWQKSVYLDTLDRTHTVHFDDLVPSARTDPPNPPLEEVSQVLFVVDTVNTKPGTSGRFWISRAEFQK